MANPTLPIDWQEERLEKALPAGQWQMWNWPLAMPLRLCAIGAKLELKNLFRR
jgi:hypothetical protein